MRTFILLLYYLCQVLTFLIFLRAILSWVAMGIRNRTFININQVVVQITEPMLAPLRRIIPRMGMVDITPIIAMLLLQIIAMVLYNVL